MVDIFNIAGYFVKTNSYYLLCKKHVFSLLIKEESNAMMQHHVQYFLYIVLQNVASIKLKSNKSTKNLKMCRKFHTSC